MGHAALLLQLGGGRGRGVQVSWAVAVQWPGWRVGGLLSAVQRALWEAFVSCC